MDRLACADVIALPLQLLLRAHPEWRGFPAAVVAEDKPQAILLWVNERARRQRILPGMRYAAALSLAADLRAAPVLESEIEAGVGALTDRLRAFSHAVEPAAGEPGVFWLSATGHELLHPSLERWSHEIWTALRQAGFHASVTAGFSRFGTYAASKGTTRRTARAFASPEEEQKVSRKVSIDRLGFEPALRDDLHKLGIRTVGGFLRLPAEGLLERFGPDAYRLHRLASGAAWAPLQPRPAEEVIHQRIDLDAPECDSERLLFLVKRALHPLFAALAERSQALQGLAIELLLDGAARERRTEHVRPAAATLDETQILDLVRLKLDAIQLQAGVMTMVLIAESTRATAEQLQLFAQKPRRDLEAAGRAFARIRAEFGEDSVVKACLRDAHLPEATFTWVKLEHLDKPKPRPAACPPMIRRIHGRPIPLPPKPRHLRDDGWLLGGLERGAVVHLEGPYVISGGWWAGSVHREYHFAETKHGELLWVYYDRRRRRWFMQGRVE